MQPSTMAVVTSTVVAIIFCGGPVPQEAFPDDYAKAYCKQLRNCDPDDWARIYNDQADCEARISETQEDVLGLITFVCDYDADKARACLTEIRTASCAEWESALDCDICE